MTVDIEIGGRVRHVEIERTGGGWRATVDGRAWAVDAQRTPGGWSLLTGPDDGAHDPSGDRLGTDSRRASYGVSVLERAPGQVTVYVDGRAVDARVIDPRAYRGAGTRGDAAGQGGGREITAPMPGRVVKVLVKTGERVSARQGLVVVEAMKMENELRAPGEAVVREVLVAEGASVEAGTVLVTLD